MLLLWQLQVEFSASCTHSCFGIADEAPGVCRMGTSPVNMPISMALGKSSQNKYCCVSLIDAVSSGEIRVFLETKKAFLLQEAQVSF